MQQHITQNIARYIPRKTARVEPRRRHSGHPLESAPERKLLLAVLKRAILDVQGTNPRLADDARDWILGTCGDELPEDFSFPWICEQLELSLDKVLEQIDGIDESSKAHG